ERMVITSNKTISNKPRHDASQQIKFPLFKVMDLSDAALYKTEILSELAKFVPTTKLQVLNQQSFANEFRFKITDVDYVDKLAKVWAIPVGDHVARVAHITNTTRQNVLSRRRWVAKSSVSNNLWTDAFLLTNLAPLGVMDIYRQSNNNH